MIALSPKVLAIAAITASLSPSVWACLELSGWTSDGFSIDGSITATDSGVQTCSGSIGGGDKNVGTYLSLTRLLETPVCFCYLAWVSFQAYLLTV